MSEPTVCADCQSSRPIRARGLCVTCYGRHRKAGTLDAWPLAENHNRGEGAPLEGISYRQLDHWVRQGYLKPDRSTPGSGSWRCWTPEERRVAGLMARLVAAGFPPAMAHEIARAGEFPFEVAPGVLVEVA